MNAMAVFLIGFIIVGVLPIVFRSKGANVFLMLCAGKALTEVFSREISDVARIVLNSSLPIDDIAKIFLTLLPAFLALIITKKAAKKRFPYHIIPSIAGGLLAGFWSVGYTSARDSFLESPTYGYVQANVAIIMLIGIVTTLFLFMIERPKPVKPEESDGHKK